MTHSDAKPQVISAETLAAVDRYIEAEPIQGKTHTMSIALSYRAPLSMTANYFNPAFIGKVGFYRVGIEIEKADGSRVSQYFNTTEIWTERTAKGILCTGEKLLTFICWDYSIKSRSSYEPVARIFERFYSEA